MYTCRYLELGNALFKIPVMMIRLTTQIQHWKRYFAFFVPCALCIGSLTLYLIINTFVIFSVPTCSIVNNIYMYRSENHWHAHVHVSLTQGVTKVTRTTSSNDEHVVQPNSRLPSHLFSVTITAPGKDVIPAQLELLEKFLITFCIRGGFALEVGARAHNLHFQGIIEIRWGITQAHVKDLAKLLKNLFPANGKGVRVLVKCCTKTQDFISMLGYILKDEGITLVSYFFWLRIQTLTQY